MHRLFRFLSIIITLLYVGLSTSYGQSSIYLQKRGGVMISIDDTPNNDANVATWETFRQLFNKYNYKFNIALQSEGLSNPTVAAKVKQMKDDGHEVMDHCPQENVNQFNFPNLEDDAKYYNGKTGFDFYNGQTGVKSVTKDGDKIGDKVYVTLNAGATLDPSALPVLAERTRLLYRRYMNESLRYPKVLAQPGSSIALSHTDGYIYLKQVGYTACAYDGDGRDDAIVKTYNISENLYHPAFNFKRADLGKIDAQTIKTVTAGIAKHQVVSILFHYTDINDTYTNITEQFLKWCKTNDVPLLTVSQWMTNLYGSTPDVTTNVFPDITKDLDGDGVGDGYEAFYNNESKLIKDASVQGGYYIQRNQIGSFFEITSLGGIEKGGNTVSFYAKGDIGTEIQVQVTTNGQQTNYSVFLTSADWTKYQTTITIPQATILADVKIALKNTVAPTYSIAISDWRLSKSVKSPVTNILSDKTITMKESLPLFAEPGCTNYLWNSGETTQNITFDGAQYGPGTFPISYTADDATGVLVADNAKITVTGAKASVSLLTLMAKSGSATFDITANIPWTITTKNGLAVATPISETNTVLNTKTITVTMADNTTLNAKEDVINITTDQGIIAIPVTQKGMDPLIVTTNAASGITISTATLNAQVNPSNTTATVTFEYGQTANYGATLNGTPNTVTGTTPTNITADLTGLTSNTTYNYRVIGNNVNGPVYGSNIIFKTPPDLPATPIANTASSLLQTTLTANWSNATKAIGYRLDLATDNAFTTILPDYNNKDIGNHTSYNVTGLSANTPYFYRVRAYNQDGDSPNSNVISFTTLPNPPLAPIANAATNILQTTFTATWSSSATATGYRIDLARDEAFTDSVKGYKNIDLGNISSIDVTGLSANKPYYYHIRAYNTGGFSPYSNTIGFITLHTPPLAPTYVTTTATAQTDFTINWAQVDTASGYKLDVSRNSDFTSYVGNFKNMDLGNTLSFKVTGLSDNKTYYYRLRAYNNGGSSPDISPIPVTTLPNPPLTPKVNTATKITQTYFTANWNKSDSTTKYYIYVATDNSFTNVIKTDSISIDTSYMAKGLSAKTQYFYKIIAHNTGGNSVPSMSMPVKTLTNPAAQMTLLKVLSCDNLVTIKWKKSTGPDIDKYRVYYYRTNITNAIIDSLEYDIKDTVQTTSILTSGQQYTFFVKAINSDGPSSLKSNELTETVRVGITPIITSKFGKILICSNVGDLIQSYQWTKDGFPITGATKQYLSFEKQTGNFQVTITDKYGCTHSSSPKTITGLKSLSAFPNPTTESFSLKVSDESEGKTVVTVFNTSGIKVIEFQTESLKNELLKEISVRNLNSGVYVVQVLFNNEDFYYTKIIVRK